MVGFQSPYLIPGGALPCLFHWEPQLWIGPRSSGCQAPLLWARELWTEQVPWALSHQHWMAIGHENHGEIWLLFLHGIFWVCNFGTKAKVWFCRVLNTVNGSWNITSPRRLVMFSSETWVTNMVQGSSRCGFRIWKFCKHGHVAFVFFCDSAHPSLSPFFYHSFL